MKVQVYVIGSVKNMDHINKVANYLEENFGDICHITHVEADTTLTLEHRIIKCFERIDCSDLIIAVSKEDGSYGDGVKYEMMYTIHHLNNGYNRLIKVNPTEDIETQLDAQQFKFRIFYTSRR